MQISDNGLKILKTLEGLRLSAYQCSAGKWTIGWGATFYANGKNVKKGDKISLAEAHELLIYHAGRFGKDVNSLVKTKLNQNQFDALLMFAFNVGSDIDIDKIPEGLGDSTLLKYVNANPNDEHIKYEFLKWNKAGGKIVDGLNKRRQIEVKLYFTKI